MVKVDLYKKCRKCGRILIPWRLRCDNCRKEIEEGLKNNIDKPFEYYFRYYIKHRWDKQKDELVEKETDSK